MAKRRKLRVIPLGGVGEIGKNSNLIEYGSNLILIDAGVKFPEEDQRGVDLVIPDYTYLKQHRDQLRGILITHGHEDHIGALPYLLPQIATPNRPIPIYGSDLALGFIEAKLRERRATQYADLLSIEPGNRYPIGQQIDAEFVPVSHSIPGSMAVVLHLPDGKVIATGDFKMDPTPISGPPTDERRLRELGDEGVLLLISDTTRAEVPGHTPSEQVVRETLERIVIEAPGRVIITTRLQHAITTAHANGRKVAVVGRSMENNTRVAVELEYLQVPFGTIIPVDQAIKLPPKQVMLITTGSQGEPSSALTRIAAGEHQKIRLRQGDTVILAASPIPGNDLTVARTIDNLFRSGANVIYSALVPTIHVSGHGARDELRRMIDLTRPKYIMPVHGEYRMLVLYQRLAADAGIPPERVPIANIGDIWQFDEQDARKLGQAPAGAVLIDGLTVGNVTTEVLRDRQHLAEDGAIFAALVVDRATGELLNGPELVARGFVHGEGDGLLDGAADEVRRALRRRGGHGSAQIGHLVERTAQVLGAYIYRQTHQRPMILPVVTEV
jgi:ribonuclease J